MHINIIAIMYPKYIFKHIFSNFFLLININIYISCRISKFQIPNGYTALSQKKVEYICFYNNAE